MNRLGWIAAAAVLVALPACKKTEPAEEKPTSASATPVAEAPAEKFEPWCDQCECADGKKIEKGKKGHQYCELSKPMKVQGKPLNAKRVGFNQEGRLVSFNLAEETKIGPVNCKKNGNVNLRPDGTLKSCWTNENLELNGVQCTGGVSLHESGKLSRCKMAAAKKMSGLDLPKGTWVTIREDGSVDRFEVATAIEVQGQTCKGYHNFLHENGKLKKCELFEEATIEGKKYEAGKGVCFDPEGKVADCSKFTFNMTG